MRITLALFLLTAPLAHADPVWAVRPETRTCVHGVAALRRYSEQPRADAPALATAGPIVFIITPLNVEAGYVEVERPNRQTGGLQQ